MNNNITLASHVRSFFTDYLRARRNVSPQTILSYRDSIRMLLDFAAQRTRKKVDRLVTENLDAETILAFLEYLETERGNTVRTRNIRLAAIRSLFHHIAARDPERLALCNQVLAIPQKRTVRPELGYLEADEIRVFAEATRRSGELAPRDLSIIGFLFNTGARVSELVDCNIEDVRWQRPYDVRIVGKGRKERYCPLWPETVELLKKSLEPRRGHEPHGPLFINRRGERLTRFGVREILKRLREEALKTCPSLARKKTGPHVFRHSAAVHLLRSGVEVNVIKAWLGHSSIETTSRYIQIDIETKRKALERCDPIPVENHEKKWKHDDDLIQWLKNL